MGRIPEFKLTEQEIEDLKLCLAEAERSNDLALYKRARALLLVGEQGLKRAEAAEICGVEVSVMYRWQPRFKKGGVAALRTRKPSGRKPRLSNEQLEKLKAVVAEGPEAAGFDTGSWSAPIVRRVLKKLFGLTYSCPQIRRLLRSLSFSYQVPKRRLARADVSAQNDWRDRRFPDILKQAVKEDAEIFLRTSRSSSSPGPSAKRGQGWV